MKTKPEQPYERVGHCCGCRALPDQTLYRVAPDVYRCAKCAFTPTTRDCPNCGGDGFSIDGEDCHACEGKGKVTR